MALTYSNYLCLDELLSLQKRLSKGPEHDEMLFIIVHQTYELWFKEILHELDRCCMLLREKKLDGCYATVKRVRTILKVAVHQMDILETLTPLEFLSFRDYLGNASGFQSYQFRELEFILGHKRERFINAFPEGDPVKKRLEKRLGEPTLWDHFLLYLSKQGFGVPGEVLDRDVKLPVEESETIREILLDIYANYPEITLFCELMVDLDEGFQEWRYRHVKMVERTLGDKTGTGGSSGVTYLKSTLFKPFFPDLWHIRSRF